MNNTSINVITDDKFFSDNYWDEVENANNAYIDKVAQHLESNDPDAKRICLEDIVIND